MESRFFDLNFSGFRFCSLGLSGKTRQDYESARAVLRITVNFECANPKPESGRKRVAEFGLLGRRELHFGVQEAPRPPRSCRNGKSTNFLGPSFAAKSDEIIDGRARICS